MWKPIDPTPEENKAFEEGFASMQGGWGGTMDRLDAYIARLPAHATSQVQSGA